MKHITIHSGLLKYISFCLLILLILMLGVATILEKIYDTDFVTTHIYGSSVFILLWGFCAATALCYLIRRKQQKQWAAFMLHISFILILGGALITHFLGLQGSVHLRQDEPGKIAFVCAEQQAEQFPFRISLKEFHLKYYPGTSAPMDFVSTVVVHDGDGTSEGKVAMNHIYTYRNYRFYQSRYDVDGKGTILAVSYDPYGIFITYTGYALLLLSIILFFFQKDSRFRKLLRHPSLRYIGVLCFLWLGGACTLHAGNAPRTLPKHVAEKFGNLYVYYNDRICPMQTLARDFTLKLCGSLTYKGLTSEQVLTGWFFYYDDWKKQPVIKIKSKKIRKLLEIKGGYACLTDFVDNKGYKLECAVSSGALQDMRAIEEANEKFNLISMVSTGSLLKIYPYLIADTEAIQNVASADTSLIADMQSAASISLTGDGPSVIWYSFADDLPKSMPDDVALFMRKSMGYVAEQVARKDYGEAGNLLDKIMKYQQKEAGNVLPSKMRFEAEKLYNRMTYTRYFAMLCVTLGVLAFIFYCRRMIRQQTGRHPITVLLLTLLGVIFLYLFLAILLRGYVSAHLPFSNGYETMQFMAVCSILLTFFFYKRFPSVIAFGYLVCGLSLIISMLGESNPPITQLMPVLQSPLLSIHVVVIMIAYSLLAFIMLNGIMALILHYSHRDCIVQVERLQIISQILLYPAVFLLTIGIFIGAVWANVSWGRYWGWDPKEVWALITMLVYALALHPDSLPCFRRPMFFHVFSIVAFLTVLITYFGVNFLLGGMHSYAAG